MCNTVNNIAAFDQLAFITRYRHLTYRDFCHLHARCTSPTVIFGPLHGCHPKSISALSQRLLRRMDILPRWGSECYGRLESILLVIVWFMAKRNVTVWGYVWCQPIHDACELPGEDWGGDREWVRELDVIGVMTGGPKRGKITRTVDQPRPENLTSRHFCRLFVYYASSYRPHYTPCSSVYVCPCVPYGLPTGKQNGVDKTSIGVNVS